MVAAHAVRGDAQAGFRTAGSVYTREGWHQRLRCSVHPVAWARYKAAETFDKRTILRPAEGLQTGIDSLPPVMYVC